MLPEVSTSSAPTLAPPHAAVRTTDAAATVQARGLQARYAELAAQPDAIAKALTGRSLAALPPAQQARLLAFAQALKAGDVAWPRWRVVQQTDAHPTAGAGDALFRGAAAAFVPGPAGARGTALLAQGLAGGDLEAAMAEELGEAIAHAAARRGIDVGAGDRGARLAAALGGRREFTAADFVAHRHDTTTVRLDGQLLPALARQRLADQALNVHFQGAQGFSLRMPVGKKTFTLKDGGRYDVDRDPGEIAMRVHLGYTGVMSVLAPNGRKVGSIDVEEYGLVQNPIQGLKGSPTHVLGKPRNNLVVVKTRPKSAKAKRPVTRPPGARRPAVMTSVGVELQAGGYALVTQGKKQFAVLPIGGTSGEASYLRAKISTREFEYIKLQWGAQIASTVQSLVNKGVEIRLSSSDRKQGTGFASFKVPYKSSGSIQIRYPYAPKLAEADLSFQFAGTPDFKVPGTQRFQGRGAGRRSTSVLSAINAGTIYVGGQTDHETIGSRLQSNLVAMSSVTFASSLSNVRITAGGNSAEQMTALRDDMMDVARIIAGFADRTQAVMADIAEAARRGVSFAQLAKNIIADLPADLTEERATELIAGVIRNQSSAIKQWLNENAANIKNAIGNFKATKKAEDAKRRMDEIMGIIDVVSGMCSMIGTAGSAIAAVKSLAVRRRNVQERFPVWREKQDIVAAKRRELDAIQGNGPDKMAAKAALAKAETDAASAEGTFNTSKDLANIGTQQLKSWSAAVPGAVLSAGTRSSRLDALHRPKAEDIPKIARQFKQDNARYAQANARLVEGRLMNMSNGTGDSLGRIVNDLDIEKSAEWKEFGKAVYAGFTEVASRFKFGTFLEKENVRDGRMTSRKAAAGRYRQTFREWFDRIKVEDFRKDPAIYYYTGHGDRVEDRGVTVPDRYRPDFIKVYKWPLPMLATFFK